MGRWTGSTQVREGLVVIGYDAASQRYSFRDVSTGKTYEGLPGDATGHSIEAYSAPIHRPVFEDSARTPPRTNTSTPPPASFHDILPSNLITTPPSKKPQTPNISPKSKFISIVRRATRPRMHAVVEDLTRRRKNGTYEQLPTDKAASALKGSAHDSRS